MPSRFMTASDRTLCTEVNETTSFKESALKANASAAFAPSVASPLPHLFRARRQASSTHGPTGSAAAGICKPM